VLFNFSEFEEDVVDWNKQAEETLKLWTSSQQKMWDSWVKAMQGIGSASQATDTWEKTVETWRESVKQALDAQTRWTQFWADSVTTGPGMNKQASEWSNQMVDMTRRWTETQSQLWDSWFETIKKSDPAAMTKAWNTEEIQKVVQTWQEAAQRAMEAQMEWARMLAAAQAQGEQK
jgi:2,4-dienoyl-CoA reductase-like NADH-dependent reductase (Old Yellow Enzyme family)